MLQNVALNDRKWKNFQNVAEYGRLWQIVALGVRMLQNVAECGRMWQNLALPSYKKNQNVAECGTQWQNLAEYGRIRHLV